MKHIFYFFTLFPLILELSKVFSIRAYHKFILSIANRETAKKNEREDEFTFIITFYCLYILWAFIGLFSFQWIIFLYLLIIGFIPKKFMILRWLDAVISFCTLLFVILNAYHFKIDVYIFIVNFIKTF